MSAFKQLTTRDVTIAPFSANKGFNFSGSAITASNVGIDIFQGVNPPGSTMSEFADPTGLISTQNTTGVYNSAKQLYYSNFLLDSKGDTVPTASLLPGALPSDNIAYGPVNAPRYENYLQSSLVQSRNFPTGKGKMTPSLQFQFPKNSMVKILYLQHLPLVIITVKSVLEVPLLQMMVKVI